MKFSGHLSEQKIIDYLLHHIKGEERSEIQSHLMICRRCAKIAESWVHVIRTDSFENMEPSPVLKEQLWSKVSERKVEANTGKRWDLKRVSVAVSIAAIFCLVFLLGHHRNSINPHYDMITDEIPYQAIQLNPNTKQLNIIPASKNKPLAGNIWINDKNQQMLLEVEGLTNFEDRDYQLWIIYSNDHIDGEILPIKNGASRVLFQGINVGEFKVIKASVEPKGGSIVQTGPDTFIVEFH